MKEAEAKYLLYLLHEHVSICYEWMDAVFSVNTPDKAKMFSVGATWDMDNAAYVSPYVLDKMEDFKYSTSKKKASIKVDDLP